MTLEVIMLKVIWEKNQSKNFLSKNLAKLCKGCTSDHSDFKYLKNIFPKKVLCSHDIGKSRVENLLKSYNSL